MKNLVYILLWFTFLYSLSIDDYNLKLEYKTPILNYESNYSSKDIFKSLIIPGWGQYSSGEYKKAFMFLCVESIAFGIYYNYNKNLNPQ